MARALDAMDDFRKRVAQIHVIGNREYNPGWHLALDLPNMLTVSEAIVRSGLERKESRGAHFREDFPAKEKSFAHVNMVIHKDSDGNMRVVQEKTRELSAELAQVIQEMK